MDNNCVFCKIIGKEIPSSTIYEDDYFVAIMDISPANKGHVILLAKSHVKDLFDLDLETGKQAMVVVSKVAKAMKEVLNCDGLNVLQNNGTAAGQTVFHYHIHLIPRFENDTVKMGWESKIYAEGELGKIVEGIRSRIQ